MPHPLQKFRSYEIAEDSRGASLELWRTDREVVCLASDPALQIFAELHVLASVDVSQESAGPVMAAFRQQTQALLRLDHAHVIRLWETGHDEGALFYLTEFIDGETLDTYLARCNPLPAWLAVELAVQVTRGLLAIRDEPSLLARVEVFNSRLALEGEMTADLRVKLADFAVGEALPRAVAPFENEHRAVREVGRLLLYALSGTVSEKVTSRMLAALPVPLELAQLLGDLLDPGAVRPTTDVSGLLAALEDSRQNPALSTWPARLPQSLRPRLMLQSHFPTLSELATRLGRGYRLERTPFDAAQPYSQRAFAGDTRAVTVQLLPPARLMAPTYLTRILLAAERVTAANSAHLLRVLELAPDQTWFIEEGAPRINVESALRFRRELTAAEAAILLREIDRAVVAAEKLGLSVGPLAPQQMFLEFITKSGGPASPADEELSTQTIEHWPSFRIRLRAHPVTARFIQPERFRRERLLARGVPGRTESPPPGLRSPEAAEYAALFAWLCGGSLRLPEDLAPLVQQTMAGSGEPDRRRFLDRILVLVPRAAKPAARVAPKAQKPPPAAREERKSPSRSPGKVPATPQGVSPMPRGVVPSASVGVTPTPGVIENPPDFRALIGGGAETAAIEDDTSGFAEMLFDRPARSNKSTDADDPGLETVSVTVDSDVEEISVGALFARNWSPGASVSAPEDLDPLEFHPPEDQRDQPGLGRLLVLIVLAALVIAIIMAHVTGLAPWR